MRKFLQILSAAVLSVAFVGSMAGAQSAGPCSGTVTVVNSGNGATSTVNCSDINNVTITCNNGVNVANVNFQGATSGSGTVTGNGSAGSSSTGPVFNQNGVSTQVGTSCGAASTSTSTSTSPTPTPSVSPSTTPGAGATVKPAALPYTASNSTETAVIAGLAAAAVIVIASRVAVAAYRRFSVK